LAVVVSIAILSDPDVQYSIRNVIRTVGAKIKGKIGDFIIEVGRALT
jgi:hypothetical protein